MSALVWFTMGVALWHFTVYVPDRFWGGIVGAFIGASAGAMVSGAIAQIALGLSIGDTDLATALYAVPGAVIGLGVIYLIGIRSGVEAEHL
jgi:ABC-type Fe3+ transport system permease subunit